MSSPLTTTPVDCVVSAADEAEQGRLLLLELAEHLRAGAPVDGALRLLEHAKARLGVAGQRAAEGLRLAGAPHRWAPR